MFTLYGIGLIGSIVSAILLVCNLRSKEYSAAFQVAIALVVSLLMVAMGK